MSERDLAESIVRGAAGGWSGLTAPLREAWFAAFGTASEWAVLAVVYVALITLSGLWHGGGDGGLGGFDGDGGGDCGGGDGGGD